MGKKYLLGLDNGGTVVKAGLYDTIGNITGAASAEVNNLLGKDGAVERDMDELWNVNAKVIRDCMEKAGVDPKDILGVAVCGHGNGLYLIDGKGRPVRKGVYSSDTRTKDYIKRYFKDGVYDAIQPKTLQILYAGQVTPLLAYFQDHEPDTIKNARWALSCADYVRYCLTGEAYGEMTNMSVASAMNQYTKEYDRDVFESLGIGKQLRLMAPLRKACDICGLVTKEAARATGLLEGTPVAGGLYDAAACAVATGITDESRFCVVAGTWGINEFICRKPAVSRDLFLTSVYCIDGYYMITEGSMTSASNLEWFVSQLMAEEKNRVAETGGNIYDTANSWVASVAPEESLLTFLPFLYGTNVNPDATACFLGLSGWHEKRHMLRAVYEGVVFSHYSHIERLLAYRDPPESIRIAGGITRSDVWMKMFADILQLPIEVSGIKELGTFGAAMCAGVAAGEYPSLSEAAAMYPKVSRIFVPNPSKNEIYQKKYRIYKEILNRLEPVWTDFK